MTKPKPEPDTTAAAAVEDAPTPAPDPDEKIRVRWAGPPRAFPDYVAAIRRNNPDRKPALILPGDILEISAHERTADHADTESTATHPINVIPED